MAIFPTTASHIKMLLAKRYCQPEWSIFFEVADEAGGRATRYTDAVAMNLWPSRGLSIVGFEIKVSRSDWVKELRDPAKADAMMRNCDQWWVVAAKGIVQDGELPPTWGLLEVDGRGLVQRTVAPKLPTPTMTRSFMAALIRRAGQFDDKEAYRLKQEATEQIRKASAEAIEREVVRRTSAHAEMAKAVKEFEEISGLKITGWQGGKEVAKVVKLVQALGIGSVYGGATAMAKTARHYADALDREIAALAVEGVEGVEDDSL